MCLCCGCCVNKEPLSKRPPPNLGDSGSSGASVNQQPGTVKPPVGSVEQKTKKDSDAGNYENVSIMK